MEYLSKYLQRSFANSRISVIRWELLLSSESRKWNFSLIRSRFSKIASFITEKGKFSIHPVLFYPVPSSDILHSSYDDVYRHTHADYQQPMIAWIFLSILVPSRAETISCLNKEDGTNKADATPDKQICIQLWRNLSGVINFIPAGDKSIGIVGNLIYTSLPRRNDPLSVESKGDGNHLSPSLSPLWYSSSNLHSRLRYYYVYTPLVTFALLLFFSFEKNRRGLSIRVTFFLGKVIRIGGIRNLSVWKREDGRFEAWTRWHGEGGGEKFLLYSRRIINYNGKSFFLSESARESESGGDACITL